MADKLPWFIGVPVAIFFLIIFSTVMINISAQFGEQQCQPYKDTISQKDNEILGLNSQLNATNILLLSCNQGYSDLLKQNITKKDFEEIKGYYNLTQIQIANVNQKFDQFNQNYNSYYSILIKNYKISRIINISVGFSLIGIELLSIALLKSEFVFFVLNAIRKRKKEEDKKEESSK